MNKKIKIEKLIVGLMKTNCYLVYDDKDLIILDPGDDNDYIVRKISDLEKNPKAIIATHGHFDHLMAATALKLIYRIPLYMNSKDLFLLDRFNSSAKHFLGIDPGPKPVIDRDLSSEERLHFLDGEFEVLDTPGHTPGSVCIVNRKERIVFVGDLFFKEGVGRYDFAYSDKNKLEESIKKVKRVAKGFKVFPGHGDAIINYV